MSACLPCDGEEAPPPVAPGVRYALPDDAMRYLRHVRFESKYTVPRVVRAPRLDPRWFDHLQTRRYDGQRLQELQPSRRSVQCSDNSEGDNVDRMEVRRTTRKRAIGQEQQQRRVEQDSDDTWGDYSLPPEDGTGATKRQCGHDHELEHGDIRSSPAQRVLPVVMDVSQSPRSPVARGHVRADWQQSALATFRRLRAALQALLEDEAATAGCLAQVTDPAYCEARGTDFPSRLPSARDMGAWRVFCLGKNPPTIRSSAVGPSSQAIPIRDDREPMVQVAEFAASDDSPSSAMTKVSVQRASAGLVRILGSLSSATRLCGISAHDIGEALGDDFVRKQPDSLAQQHIDGVRGDTGRGSSVDEAEPEAYEFEEDCDEQDAIDDEDEYASSSDSFVVVSSRSGAVEPSLQPADATSAAVFNSEERDMDVHRGYVPALSTLLQLTHEQLITLVEFHTEWLRPKFVAMTPRAAQWIWALLLCIGEPLHANTAAMLADLRCVLFEKRNKVLASYATLPGAALPEGHAGPPALITSSEVAILADLAPIDMLITVIENYFGQREFSFE